MKKLDFKSVADAALNAADNLLAEWLPGGKYKGHEFFALNPTRADRHLGSFAVNTHSGAWADYATGDAGGDLISLYAYLFTNGNQGDAFRAVADRLNIGNFQPVQRVEWDGTPKTGNAKSKRDSWRPVVPFDEERLLHLSGSRAYSFARNGREEGLRAVYRDAEGRPLCVVQRFIEPGGGKSDYPFSWCNNAEGVQQWCNRRVNDPQPLFGLDALAAHPDLPVLVVEGEKCKIVADASGLLGGWVVVSWLGGCNGWKKADWLPLSGRNVVLWPDCDSQREKLTKAEAAAGIDPHSKPFLAKAAQPGFKAMAGIAEKLAGLDCSVRMVQIPEPGVWPCGYDIADAFADGGKLIDPVAALADSALIPWPPENAESFPHLSDDERVRETTHAANEGGAGADYAENNGWRDDELAESDDEMHGLMADLLENYSQIGLKMKAVNLITGETFTRSQMEKIFTKFAVNAWFNSPNRKTMAEFQAEITIKQRRLEALAEYDNFGGMIDRYIYLDGTTDAFDVALGKIVSLAAVKAAFPEQCENWQKSAARKVCPMSNYVFEPALPPGISYTGDGEKVKFINMFKGLPVKSDEPDMLFPSETPLEKIKAAYPKCKHIIGLIEHLCGGNGRMSGDVTEWVLNWLACRFRWPQRKPATALVFISETQGVGKSTLGNKVLKELFGDYFVKLNQNALESQFNAPFQNRLVTVFEEISPSDERKNVIGKFKDMITSETIMIERKGKDPLEYSDYNSFLVFSNDEKAIPIEANDRRFMVMEIREKFSDAQYEALQAEIDAGGIQAFADFLFALPLQYTAGYQRRDDGGNIRMVPVRATFTPHTKPLPTPIKNRMIGLNKSGWEAFFDDWYQGELGLPFITCAAADLWAVYKAWCADTKTFSMTQKNFYASIAKRLQDIRTRVKVDGLEKRLRIFIVPHSWMSKRDQDRYPEPNTGAVFNGDSNTINKADYFGRQISAFNAAASVDLPHLKNL